MDTIGTLAWASQTQGRLTNRERMQLLGPVFNTALTFLFGRLRMSVGIRAPRRGSVDLDNMVWPDSALARAAEEACHDTLSPAVINHSYRTFVFALALASVDGLVEGRDFDLEHLYVTSLLHDIALETPTPGCCFAVRGGQIMHEVALEAGTDPETADQLANAIACHITPGISHHDVGWLAPLIQSGAMVDLTGLRLWDVSAATIAAAIERYPRVDLKKELPKRWRAEMAANPGMRAAFIEKASLFTFFVSIAPFADQ